MALLVRQPSDADDDAILRRGADRRAYAAAVAVAGRAGAFYINGVVHHRDPIQRHADRFQLADERLRRRHDALRTAQRHAVELVVDRHLQVGPRVPVVKRDPRMRTCDTGRDGNQMRLDAVRLHDIGPERPNEATNGGKRPEIEAAPFGHRHERQAGCLGGGAQRRAGGNRTAALEDRNRQAYVAPRRAVKLEQVRGGSRDGVRFEKCENFQQPAGRHAAADCNQRSRHCARA